MNVWDKIDSIINNSKNNTRQETKNNIQKKNKNDVYAVELYINHTRQGSYINIKNVPQDIVNKIKNYFTIRDKTIMGYEKKTCCFKYDDINKKLYIPRFGAFLLSKKFNQIAYNNCITVDNKINMSYIGEEPTFIQQLIIDHINETYFLHNNVSVGKCGIIINLQAGYGKTYLAMKLIAQLMSRTLIVVHNKTILKQWKDLLLTKFPNNSIGYYYGEKKEFGDIVVGVINSLILPDIKGFNSPNEFYNKFDVIIFDECHEYCAPGRSKIFDVCQCPYMIGLSATPEERNDNLSRVIKWNIGPVLDASTLEGYTIKDIPFKGNVVQVCYSGPDAFTKSIINKKLETVSATKMIEQFTEDPNRTKTVVDLVVEFYNKNHNIFVFADRRDYLEKINKELKIAYLESKILTNDKELESIRLVGGSSENDMIDAKENKRIILTTYAYMGTGCSIPRMDCIILATPRRTKSRQIINRIFRLGSDYSIVRQIIDIVDWKTSLKNQWYERLKYYKSQNFSIEVRKIKY